MYDKGKMTVEQFAEYIDSLVVDCNDSIKQIMGGNCLAWCGIMHNMAQKLLALKTTLQEEIKGRDEQIRTLQRFVDDLNNDLKFGGDSNGNS